MKRRIFLFIGAFFIYQPFLYSQVIFTGETAHFPPVVCYGIPVDANVKILPPPELITRMKSANAKKADIRVTYHNFPSAAKTAFDYAVNIWANLIYSPVPVRIDATWESLSSGVLGSTGPSVYYRGFDGSADVYKYYPVVLMERMIGRDINGEDQPDMYASFSNNTTLWYLGTDGNCPSGKYDFVTTVLHELCHGFGFIKSFIWSAGMGDYGLGNDHIPVIFDKYVVDNRSVHLIDQNFYSRSSALLGSALTSESLYFKSVLSQKVNSNQFPHLYAPDPWDPGSSIAHLDDATYDQTKNALMTHATQTREVIHDPGPIALAMLGEIGWIHTWIKHDTLPDIEEITAPVEVKAVITSDTAISKNSIRLYFSTDSFATSTEKPMLPTGKPHEYAASIPLSKPEQRFFYYISVKDTFQRQFTAPSGAPDFAYSFYVGEDTLKPYIQHQAVPYVLVTADSVLLEAVVRDNVGVDTVYVEYRVNQIPQPSLPLRHDSLVYYSGSIPVKATGLTDDDTIFYRIVAMDKSHARNTSILPDTGYFVIQVEPVPEPVRTYHNDFNTQTFDFLLNGFSITQPPDFFTPGLHSDHPYKSPDMDNQKFNFTAQLRVPIILTGPATYLTFWEIALVEPGEEGSVYGSDSFYDYVVVEGSKNGGSTWKAFAPGWDCRAYPEWLNRWNSSKDAMGNSLALAGMSYYKIRVINLLSDSYFQPEDTVMIRFRLFSDPYAHGWGWAIDNIHIQDFVGIANPTVTAEDVLVYPNPASTNVTVELRNIASGNGIQVSLFNMMGQLEWNKDVACTGQDISLDIPVGHLPEGIYLMKAVQGSTAVTRKIIIQH